MVLVFHHVIIFFLLSDWLIQILPPFWFCCDVACFCFGSETQLKCTYRRCCQFFKNIVLCLDVLSGRESASMATFFGLAPLLSPGTTISKRLIVVVSWNKLENFCIGKCSILSILGNVTKSSPGKKLANVWMSGLANDVLANVQIS